MNINLLSLKKINIEKYNNYNYLYNYINNCNYKLINFITNTLNLNFKYCTETNIIYNINSFKKNIFLKFLINNIKKSEDKNNLINSKKNKKLYNIKLKLFKLFLNKKFNIIYNSHIFLNFKFKSKGNINILNQIINFRGNILNNNNKVIKYPVINTFKKGLDDFEFIISSYGTRKGLLETSSNTSNSGYLNKKLMEYSNNIIINEFDCLTSKYVKYNEYINYKGEIKKNFLLNFIQKYTFILFNVNLNLHTNNLMYFKFRNILSCINLKNICSKCYNMFTNNYINVNIPIGIIITHFITEPLTQSTLKNFHTGGIKDLNTKNTLYIKNNIHYYNKKYLITKFLKNNCKFIKINVKNNIKINKINSIKNKYKYVCNYILIYKNFNNYYKIKYIKNNLNLRFNYNFINLYKHSNLIINYYVYINLINNYIFNNSNIITNNILYVYKNLYINIKGFKNLNDSIKY